MTDNGWGDRLTPSEVARLAEITIETNALNRQALETTATAIGHLNDAVVQVKRANRYTRIALIALGVSVGTAVLGLFLTVALAKRLLHL